MTRTSFWNIHCNYWLPMRTMPRNVMAWQTHITFTDFSWKTMSIKFSIRLIPIWKWDQQWLYAHVSLAWMNTTFSFLFEPRKDIHWLLLTSSLRVVTCPTVAPCVCFTKLSTTACSIGPYWFHLKNEFNWNESNCKIQFENGSLLFRKVICSE